VTGIALLLSGRRRLPPLSVAVTVIVTCPANALEAIRSRELLKIAGVWNHS